MLFFKLPYRYATEGEASANDDADRMDKLEEEILGYSGYGLLTLACDLPVLIHFQIPIHVCARNVFRVPPSSAFIPGVTGGSLEYHSVSETLKRAHPECYAKRTSKLNILFIFSHGPHGSRLQFDPVPSTPPTGSSLIPVRRKPDEPDVVQDGYFLPDIPPTPTEQIGDTAVELDDNNTMLRIFPLLSDRRLDAANSFVERFTPLHWGLPRLAWVNSLKACILAAKVRFQQRLFVYRVLIGLS